MQYDISITGYDSGEVPCTDWSDALDELDKPQPAGLTFFIDSCAQFYPTFSQWNGLAFSQADISEFYLGFVYGLQCYQRIDEFVCYSVFPKCQNGTVTQPCSDMCADIRQGCTSAELFYNVTCTSYNDRGNAADGQPCFYESCQCDSPVLIPEHGAIVSAVVTWRRTRR